MNCPYKDFKECIVEKCPSCNYEKIIDKVICGKYPAWMNYIEAIRCGNAWVENKTTYKFISCKLSENNVQPVLRDIKKETINNTQTNVIIRKSIF
jgi:hypothetical protein